MFCSTVQCRWFCFGVLVIPHVMPFLDTKLLRPARRGRSSLNWSCVSIHGLSKIGVYMGVPENGNVHVENDELPWDFWDFNLRPKSIEGRQSLATSISLKICTIQSRPILTRLVFAGHFSVRMLNYYTRATAFCPGRTSGWAEFLDWTMTFTAYPATKPLKPG